MSRRREWIVRGRVQGVGYRAFARAEAARLGIAAVATNLADGTVRVEAEGAAEALDAYASRLAEGPSFARVDGIERSGSDSARGASEDEERRAAGAR